MVAKDRTESVVSEKSRVSLWLRLSVAVTENVTVPALGGVPLKYPPEFNINQAGRLAPVHV